MRRESSDSEIFEAQKTESGEKDKFSLKRLQQKKKFDIKTRVSTKNKQNEQTNKNGLEPSTKGKISTEKKV